MTLLQSLHQNAWSTLLYCYSACRVIWGFNLCTASDRQCATTSRRSIARNHCNAVNLKCNTAVLDWNKSVRANPGPTRVIQTVQVLSGDKHKGCNILTSCRLPIFQEQVLHTCCHAFVSILAEYHCCNWSPGLWWSASYTTWLQGQRMSLLVLLSCDAISSCIA